MHRTAGIPLIALAAITLSGTMSLALGLGSGAGTLGAAIACAAPAASPVASMGGGFTAGPPPQPGRGTPTPRAKKLSPKAGAACFRACMRGVSGAGWGNFCDYSCYGH